VETVDFFTLSQTLEVGFDGERVKLHEALDGAIEKAAKASLSSGKKAKISMNIETKPDGGQSLTIKAVMKTAIPEPNTSEVTIYADRRGNLTFDDAEQGKLPADLAVVGGERQ